MMSTFSQKSCSFNDKMLALTAMVSMAMAAAMPVMMPLKSLMVSVRLPKPVRMVSSTDGIALSTFVQKSATSAITGFSAS